MKNRTYLMVAAAMVPLLIYLVILVWKTAHGEAPFAGQPALILGVGSILAIGSAALANFIRLRRERSSRSCA